MPVLVLYSDPNFADSDSDGIMDANDDQPSDEDIISIDDEIIDDSKIFENDYQTINNFKVSGNGVASSIGDKKNNSINYTRIINSKKKSISKYIIEPKENSDYLITVDTGINDDYSIEIYYETGISSKSKTKTNIDNIKLDDNIMEEETDNFTKHHRKAYALEKGKIYHINISIVPIHSVNNIYNVIVEQNNWVYAPNGGYDFTKINNYMQTKTVYTDDDGLFNMLKEAVEVLRGPDEMPFENIDKYLEKKNDEQILYVSIDDAKKLIDMHKKILRI